VKTYNELTADEKTQAESKCLCSLLRAVVEGAISFYDRNSGDLQARIDAACEKAEEMQTPWFTHEYVMDTCSDDLQGMAWGEAEEALYSEPGENVIAGVVGE